MFENVPPTYTVGPETTISCTLPSEFGFQLVARPVEASTAAIRFLACPPMLVKSPPGYTVEPETATAKTSELGFGIQLVASPVVASSAAKLLRA